MSEVAAWIECGELRSDYQVVTSLTHPQAGAALSFWERRPPDGIVIGRDIPSRLIARLLSRIIVYEPIDEGRDFRVHLAGTSIRRRFARDITGERMSELFGSSDFPIRYRTMRDAVEQGVPKMARISHSTANTEVLRLELFMLPVVAPDGSDIWALTFCFYF